MADYCNICDTRRPKGGTRILVLNGGKLWVEFCERCASTPIKNAETGEETTVGELYERCRDSRQPEAQAV